MAAKTGSRAIGEPARFRVGDQVKVWLGLEWADGVIVEDRGPFGGGGHRIYRITIQPTATDPMTFETREEWLAPADSPAPTG